MAIPTKRRDRRPLRWLAAGIVGAAGSGMLLGVPPFSIWPLYPYVRLFHGWLGVAIALPAALAVLLHGVIAWRRNGFQRLTRTGLLLGAALVVTLTTGTILFSAPEVPPTSLIVHMGAGAVALIAALLHGLRSGTGKPEP